MMAQRVELDIPSSNDDYFLTMVDESDAQAIYDILIIDEVNDNLLRVPKPYTLQLAQSWVSSQLSSQKTLLTLSDISDRRRAFFAQKQEDPLSLPLKAIRHLAPNGPFVGVVSLAYGFGPLSDKVSRWNMGYYLHPSHQHKGVMLAAAKASLKLAKDEFGITEAAGCADHENVCSVRLMEKIASQTCRGGKEEVVRGHGTLTWPGEKRGRRVGDDVERECFTWQWKF